MLSTPAGRLETVFDTNFSAPAAGDMPVTSVAYHVGRKFDQASGATELSTPAKSGRDASAALALAGASRPPFICSRRTSSIFASCEGLNQSGIEVEQEFSHSYTVRDGKVVEWRHHDSYEQALEAVGLRE